MAATIAGIAVGLAGAAAATRVIETLLFSVTRWNPLAFAAAPVVLALWALAGIGWRARRATAIGPLAVFGNSRGGGTTVRVGAALVAARRECSVTPVTVNAV